jgi:predicted GNAT family acetyltransferase
MRKIVIGWVEASIFFQWKDKGKICAVAQIIYNDDGAAFIGHLFTKKEYRNKGYAASILYAITKGLLEAGHKVCGLVSDSTNPASNKVFIKVGYIQIGEHIAVTKEKWRNDK